MHTFICILAGGLAAYSSVTGRQQLFDANIDLLVTVFMAVLAGSLNKEALEKILFTKRGEGESD